MNASVLSAVLDIATLFGAPLAAIAGGWALRRRYRERPPRLARHAGTVLMAGGVLALLAVFAIILMMRHW